jgi:hypothetical protein
MRARDPFQPLSRKKAVVYGVVALAVLGIAAISLGSMEGGYRPASFFRILALLGLPLLVLLTLVAWLSSGERIDIETPAGRTKLPVRLRRVLPYLFGITILINLIRAWDLIFG